ncbi:hypothetical protein GUITHDRAFT_134979 [Guillardia theta CCMP2712]|uniref:RING-type domain-containing protein n=2 Tax=Guillardia theta TaxID=55529 RepID=L1JRT1_GUITC|nr:hypothetical protein GUITHDRAFT_134979 [Guillardia theta CCMP2712]EKX50885.1 hypothetical protein GUITHDRAFT_134979 [Guillardia theta CCMP2712]|eukprot:XP_005837865.1 hypothetical protein GUITHDRAFT_134979 [Guillardia theta CCMP2712]
MVAHKDKTAIHRGSGERQGAMGRMKHNGGSLNERQDLEGSKHGGIGGQPEGLQVDIKVEDGRKARKHKRGYSPSPSVKKMKTGEQEEEEAADPILDKLGRKLYTNLIAEMRVKEEELEGSLAREADLHYKLSVSTRELKTYRNMADELSEAMECSICLERPARFAFNPCGHCFCCHESCGSFQVRKCPECRVTKKGKLHLYGVFTAISSVLERFTSLRESEGTAEEEGEPKKSHDAVRVRVVESEMESLRYELGAYKEEAGRLHAELTQAEEQVQSLMLQLEQSRWAEDDVRQQLEAVKEEKTWCEKEMKETRKTFNEAKKEMEAVAKQVEMWRKEHLEKFEEWEVERREREKADEERAKREEERRKGEEEERKKEEQERKKKEEEREKEEQERKKKEEERKKEQVELMKDVKGEVDLMREELRQCHDDLQSELQALTLNDTIKQKCVKWLRDELTTANKERDEACKELSERVEAEKRFRALLEVACKAAERDRERVKELEHAQEAIIMCMQDMENRVEGLKVVINDLDLFLPHYREESNRKDAAASTSSARRRGDSCIIFRSMDPRLQIGSSQQRARRIDLSTYRSRMTSAFSAQKADIPPVLPHTT